MPRKAMSRTNPSALACLGSEESAQVLTLLLKNHPQLRDEADALALRMITAVEPKCVADDLVFAFEDIEQEDIWDHSGADRYGGYTDPGEAADDLCEERLRPFHEELERLFAMGLAEPALAQVKGMLLGLHQAKATLPPDAEEYPAESGAFSVLEAWVRHTPAEADPQLMAWIAKELPDWAAHLENTKVLLRKPAGKAP